MARKNAKNAGFDDVLDSFIRSYHIPTQKDIDRLITRIDNLENLIRRLSASIPSPGKRGAKDASRSEGRAGGTSGNASSAVLNVIANSRKGADFTQIQDQTGFDGKKIRNIIFRLNKIGKIKRKNRGTYTIVGAE